MRLPVSLIPSVFYDRVVRAVSVRTLAPAAVLCLCAGCWFSPHVAAQDQAGANAGLYRSSADSERERLHETEQWRNIQSHLPDPATATPSVLEQEGDILRARRFPQDALDFYNHALTRGGNPQALLNKIGLTELEMHNTQLAELNFRRSLKLAPKNPQVWNNLAATEYLDSGVEAAIRDYKHAIKLDKNDAVFHANLATSYMETKNFNSARREMTTALRLDPAVFDKQSAAGGMQAHILSSHDRARFAYEMARLYASSGDEDQMLHSLSMASEAGMDVQHEMHRDLMLVKYENDPRVVLLVHNAEMLRAGGAPATSPPMPGDSEATPAPPKPLSE